MTQHTVRLVPGGPVRPIRSGHRGTASVLRKRVAFGSAPERAFLALLVFDPDLADLREQPVRIDDRGDRGSARLHTPDFLMLYGGESQGYMFSRIVKWKSHEAHLAGAIGMGQHGAKAFAGTAAQRGRC